MIVVEDARDATMALLAERRPDATICPSEVARALAATAGAPTGGEDWRGLMPVVHAAVDQLLTEHVVQLSWKGEALAARTGPYRIRRRSAE